MLISENRLCKEITGKTLLICDTSCNMNNINKETIKVGKGVRFSLKEYAIKEYLKGKNIIIIDPNHEWEELTKIFKEKGEYETMGGICGLFKNTKGEKDTKNLKTKENATKKVAEKKSNKKVVKKTTKNLNNKEK